MCVCAQACVGVINETHAFQCDFPEWGGCYFLGILSFFFTHIKTPWEVQSLALARGCWEGVCLEGGVNMSLNATPSLWTTLSLHSALHSSLFISPSAPLFCCHLLCLSHPFVSSPWLVFVQWSAISSPVSPGPTSTGLLI